MRCRFGRNGSVGMKGGVFVAGCSRRWGLGRHGRSGDEQKARGDEQRVPESGGDRLEHGSSIHRIHILRGLGLCRYLKPSGCLPHRMQAQLRVSVHIADAIEIDGVMSTRPGQDLFHVKYLERRLGLPWIRRVEETGPISRMTRSRPPQGDRPRSSPTEGLGASRQFRALESRSFRTSGTGSSRH